MFVCFALFGMVESFGCCFLFAVGLFGGIFPYVCFCFGLFWVFCLVVCLFFAYKRVYKENNIRHIILFGFLFDCMFV